MSQANDPYYIVLRGAGRQPIFNNDDDRNHFTQIVAAQADACGVTVYAYCWLKAEARLAAQPSDIPVSRFAQLVGKQHALRLEREIPITGAHFEQKCRGVKVDGQTGLVDLVRHIHLAPVKAGLAIDPADHPWSSHRVYLGRAEAPWIATEPVLKYFRQTGGDAVRGYMQFMAEGADNLEGLVPPTEPPPGIRPTTRGSQRSQKK